MNYLAIDPGSEYCGWAFQKESVVKCATLNPDNLLGLLGVLMTKTMESCPDVVIVEEFKLYPWASNAHIWSDMPVCKLIGKIEYICEKNNVPIIYQPASIKKLPFIKKEIKNCGIEFETQHERDAYMHLAYYLEVVKNGNIKK